MNGDPHEQDRLRIDSRPFLLIPYWPFSATYPGGDTGEIRPVPETLVPYYLCPDVQASNYAPGTDLTVTVQIRNRGGANTPQLAQVSVWWTEPSSGFVIDPDKLIGFDLVPVPPRGDFAKTKPMTKRIPPSAPDHICLLARVSHQFDRAPATPMPGGDRHWAQRNLSVISAADQTQIPFQFWAGNPFTEGAEFTLALRPMGTEHAAMVSREVRAGPDEVGARLAMSENRDQVEREAGERIGIRLRAGERKPVFVRIELTRPPERDRFVGFEVVQHHERSDRTVGAIGIAIRGR